MDLVYEELSPYLWAIGGVLFLKDLAIWTRSPSVVDLSGLLRI